MSHVTVSVCIGDRESTVKLPVKITRFVRQPHTYEVNDIEEKIQQAATKAVEALGMERQK